MKCFALVGNPNCGKTTLYNSLTGSTAHVGNWPGVTVDKREGVCGLGKDKINIIDLPGIYSLSPYTPEEVVTRNYIIDEKPDCVINIIDSTNIERNLYLTTQLMEMDVPIIVALNMIDILEKNGDTIDEKELSKQLKVPVVKISALKNNNLKKLVDKALETSSVAREGKTVLEDSHLSHLIKDLTIAFHGLGVNDPLFHATKLAESDELEMKNHPKLVHMVEHFKEENVDSKFGNDFEALIADNRYNFIEKYCSPTITKKKENDREVSKSDKIDRVLTNKWAGIPIFIIILFFIFHFTFSENLFYLGGLFKNIEPCFSSLEGTYFEGLVGLFYTDQGINSPGIMLSNLVGGLCGALKDVIITGLTKVSSPDWVIGLVGDGILGGVISVFAFLPQILLLFGLFSILEDTGYMSRIAFILDRMLKRFGLSGRAFLPMIMGFGCSVPAIINTRTIADEKERQATLRVIPFFACGAKLPILTAIAGAIVASFGVANADVITLGMYLLGIVTAIISVLLMRKTTLKGETSPFVMELPSYHLPQFKSTMLLIWDKAKHFIKKAFTVILASTIVIWFISHFGPSDNGLWAYVGNDMEYSILVMVGKIIQPVFVPVGFGLGKYGWVFVVAMITGLIAKENVIATLATLTSSILTSNGIILSLGENPLNRFISELSNAGPIHDAMFSDHAVPILLAFIAFNLLTIPCVATLGTAKAELPKGKFSWTILFWIAVSFFAGSMIFVIGSWWYFVFAYVLVLVMVFIAIELVNKRSKRKENKL